MKNLAYLLALILCFSAACHGQESQKTPVRSSRKNVAILIFNGVQIIDFTGPYEVFGQAGYNVFTIAENKDAITTHMKLDVLPKYDFTHHPEVDIMVVPGGGAPHKLDKDDPTIQWISHTSEKADYILSVCNGVFLLASADLLHGREVTTYAPMINHITMYAPDTKPIYDKRFVQSGNIITAGGLSAGIDASLHVVSLDKGSGRAREVANNMEYNWDQNSRYVRSQLADMLLANVLDFNPPLFNREVIRYEGDTTYWICHYKVTRNESLKEFYTQFEQGATMYQWKKEEEKLGDHSIISKWRFTDFNDRNWTCETQFSDDEDSGKFNLLIDLQSQ